MKIEFKRKKDLKAYICFLEAALRAATASLYLKEKVSFWEQCQKNKEERERINRMMGRNFYEL